MVFTEAEELSQVMAEIAAALGARAAALTWHPDGHTEIVSAAVPFSTDDLRKYVSDEAALARRAEDGDYFWRACAFDSHDYDVLSLAVDRLEGSSRYWIHALFEKLSDEARAHAEQVYLKRRPFAVGYFRLWQLDRSRGRRIAALEAALNLTEVGVLLINRAGGISFANDAATTLLNAADGLRRYRSSIAGSEMRDSLHLQVAVDHVISMNGTAAAARRAPLLTLARRDAAPLIVSVLPTETRAIEESDVAAIIYVLDPALDTDQMLEPVCKLYSLTPVETRLVCLLASGETLADAACRMHVKEQTARSSLKQVFLKTSTNRQSDLIRLMLSNLARTSRSIPADVV